MAKEGGRYIVGKDGKETRVDPKTDDNHTYAGASREAIAKVNDAQLEPTPVSPPAQPAAGDGAAVKG